MTALGGNNSKRIIKYLFVAAPVTSMFKGASIQTGTIKILNSVVKSDGNYET